MMNFKCKVNNSWLLFSHDIENSVFATMALSLATSTLDLMILVVILFPYSIIINFAPQL